MIRVHLAAVRVDLQSNTPVLLLEEEQGLGRTLPIFIGTPEATAIAYAVQGVEVPRPMTHDLLATVISELGATLERIVVTALVQSTYFAELHLLVGGQSKIISCRPSDAVAIAVRSGADLFVTQGLMDAEGVILATDDDDDDDSEEVIPEALVDEFKAFLESIHPEDFTS